MDSVDTSRVIKEQKLTLIRIYASFIDVKIVEYINTRDETNNKRIEKEIQGLIRKLNNL